MNLKIHLRDRESESTLVIVIALSSMIVNDLDWFQFTDYAWIWVLIFASFSDFDQLIMSDFNWLAVVGYDLIWSVMFDCGW